MSSVLFTFAQDAKGSFAMFSVCFQQVLLEHFLRLFVSNKMNNSMFFGMFLYAKVFFPS